ncbi:MAG: MarR family transcriptional regulator [Chitinophagales bacterium]
MKLPEARDKFINAWGRLGSSWGINRTMAQVHAFLLISPEPMSAENIMKELKISRGNANMNLRELINWGLVEKEHVKGERREFFSAEKDIWKVAMQIAKERKKRELEPVKKLLDELEKVEGDKREKNHKAFNEMVAAIQELVSKTDQSIETFIKMDANWFFGTFLKILR